MRSRSRRFACRCGDCSAYRFPALAEESFHGLPGLLADSLPDRYGNALIDAWLATQGREPGSFNAVERLCYIGRRGMGALEFAPARGPRPASSHAIDIEALVELAGEVLAARSDLAVSLRNQAKAGCAAGDPPGGHFRRRGAGEGLDRAQPRARSRSGPDSWRPTRASSTGSSSSTASTTRRATWVAPGATAPIELVYCGNGAPGRHRDDRVQTARRERQAALHDASGSTGPPTAASSTCSPWRPSPISTSAGQGPTPTSRPSRRSGRWGCRRRATEQQFRRMVFNIVARNQDDHVKNIAFLMDRSGQLVPLPRLRRRLRLQPGRTLDLTAPDVRQRKARRLHPGGPA